MQQVSQEFIAQMSSVMAEIMAKALAQNGMSVANEKEPAKQLADFSKTFISTIEKKFKRIANAQFIIGGVSYVSIHSISKVLGWGLADWSKMIQVAEARYDYKRSDKDQLSRDGGVTEIKGASTHGTVFIKAAEIESLVLAARPRKGKTALAEFKARNGLPT